MEIVNGYPCRDCTDVALAKRGVDPSLPKAQQRDALAGREDAAPKLDPTRLLDMRV